MMKIKSFLKDACTIAALSLLITSCESKDRKDQAKQANVVITEAYSTLKPTEGNEVKGKVAFIKVEGGVKVVAEVTGLKPGKHGFHIHEHGDCSAPDGSSAGAHFNPTHAQHGGPTDHDRHVGDLGNIVADEEGNARYEYIDKYLELTGPNTIVGRSVVVHADADDFKTQPTGNSGGRVACGVIE